MSDETSSPPSPAGSAPVASDPSACIFCKIARGLIGTPLEHQDELCVAFRDLNPQAPFHLLVIPRQHIFGLTQARAEDTELLGHLLVTGARLASSAGYGDSGYRAVINSGQDGGQTVGHLHLHILAGRKLTWPPG